MMALSVLLLSDVPDIYDGLIRGISSDGYWLSTLWLERLSWVGLVLSS